jgi:hypothetical protein
VRRTTFLDAVIPVKLGPRVQDDTGCFHPHTLALTAVCMCPRCAAGLVGVLHAAKAASWRMALPISHLRTLNPSAQEATGTAAAAAWALPRQPGPLALPSTAAMGGEALVAGVSAFAFQVSYTHSRMVTGFPLIGSPPPSQLRCAKTRKHCM